ncbi:MAG: uracil-DNA glycosylase family protein [Candidatus Woesearchaeota archaeon]
MQIETLFKSFDALQKLYGDESLSAIYGAGQIKNPKFCFVFMNPTGKNVSAAKTWKGLKAPWIGTKQVWKMLYALGLFDKNLLDEINCMKSSDWSPEFASKVYKNVKEHSVYITNLSKATQLDARPLKNEVFRNYLSLLHEELLTVNPRVIITFGNQVSSILLGKPIKVSEYRKKKESIVINGRTFNVYPVYYPVGQGLRNMNLAVEDISSIMQII